MRPPPRTARRPEEVKEIERKTKTMLDLERKRPNTSYVLNANVADYEHPIGSRSTETRREHLENHLPSSLSVINGVKSPTALGGQSGTFEDVLGSASIIATSTQSDLMVEYLDTTGRSPAIIKVSMVASGRIEVTVLRAVPGPNGHELVTTYDNVSIENVKAKVDSGKWA